MKYLPKLFKNNQKWVQEKLASRKNFFRRLVDQQTPQYLWIGCSDSRVPANDIVGLQPGDLFVHRNVANIVIHNDMNCLSVIQYAVEILKVKHIIVCGHYGCGGIKSAIENTSHGMINNWLSHIRDIQHNNLNELNSLSAMSAKIDRLSEINVQVQVLNVCKSAIVQKAWKRNQNITVHGWIYNIKDGLLKDLKTSISSVKELKSKY